jgi:membrane-bound metal-dependent hydrolase YbcI (DUF457 family)
MTSRTHDLGAFTGFHLTLYLTTIPPMTTLTLLVAFGANFIGGVLPDLDNVSTKFWSLVRGGDFVAKLISPLLGGHRMISHSLLGLALFYHLLQYLLNHYSSSLIVDHSIVLNAFLIGFSSHLILDSVTKQGIPLFFPLPVRIGIPPIQVLRVTTGTWIEKLLVFPGLLGFNFYIAITHPEKLLQFFTGF